MKIRKTYIAYSHRPGFRRFGREWNKEPITIGEVEALPNGTDPGSEPREHDDVDLLATSREIAKLIELNREEAYPLRIAEGATDATARASKEARAELDQVREAIAAARQVREVAEKEAESAREEAETLTAQLNELQDALAAAEAEARAKEAEVETLKAEVAELAKGRDEARKSGKPARKENAKG